MRSARAILPEWVPVDLIPQRENSQVRFKQHAELGDSTRQRRRRTVFTQEATARVKPQRALTQHHSSRAWTRMPSCVITGALQTTSLPGGTERESLRCALGVGGRFSASTSTCCERSHKVSCEYDTAASCETVQLTMKNGRFF